MPPAGITAQITEVSLDDMVQGVSEAPEHDNVPCSKLSRKSVTFSSDVIPETSQTVVRLLREILDHQREQLHVQKTQLSVLEGHWQHEVGSVAVVEAQNNFPKDGHLIDGEESGPSVNVCDDESEKTSDDDSCRNTHPVTKSPTRTASSYTLSEMLANPVFEESSMHHRERIRELSFKSMSRLPSSLSKKPFVFRHLIAAGVLPSNMIVNRRKYSLYCAMLIFAECMHCVMLIKGMAISISEGLNASANIVLLFSQLVLFHPLWYTWKKEFKRMGPTLQLLQQMARRDFAWTPLRTSIRMCQAISVLFVLSGMSLWSIYISDGTSVTLVLLRRDSSLYDKVMGRISAVIDVISIPCQLLWLSVSPIHIWIVYLVARLHCHDLLCYARAVVGAFEADTAHDGIDVMFVLRKLEVIVTARLRLANERWVRFVCFYMFCLCMSGLIILVFLLTSGNIPYEDLIFYSFIFIFGFIFLTSLISPLAMVAESFEYDVLRALNTASILKAAQKHVGQQLLGHLKQLDWGFRIGGSTITPKMVSNVVIAVMVTIVTTLSQAAFKKNHDL